jgi:16S rRNA (guanine1516-N2)-methyltransferase
MILLLLRESKLCFTLNIGSHSAVSRQSFLFDENPTSSASNTDNLKVYLIDDDCPFQSDAQDIASSLHIPLSSQLASTEAETYSHALQLVPYECDNVSTFALAVEGLNVDQKSRRRRPKQKPKSNPFFIDFCPDKNSRMGKRGSRESGTDLLIKAVAPKKSSRYSVLDLTAGFGQDSLILALNGASRVCMVERDPIVFALLQDAMRRINLLSPHSELAQLLSESLSLRAGDGKDFIRSKVLEGIEDRPDICYLDPMFPPRTKSAAVKKGMQILHGLLDTQQTNDDSVKERLEEERQLLKAALEAAKSRVVIKRPLKSPPLGGEDSETQCPSYAIEGSVNRWDVYVKNQP